MPTVEDVARHLAGITSTEDDILLIGNWVNQRWIELATTHSLKMLRRIGELTTSAAFQDGTITANNGSTIVTGTATNWTNVLEGQHLRQRTTWHEILNVVSPTELRLKSPFSEPDVVGAGYLICQRRYVLEPDIRRLGVFTHMRLRRELHRSTDEGLDLAHPSRLQVNSAPRFVVEIEPDENGDKQVEIYPFTRTPELIHYLYWLEPFNLDFKDKLPEFIDIEAFREGVMIDIMRNKMFKLSDDGRQRESELLRNEYRAQETRWNNTFKHRVISQDEALDDNEFLLVSAPAHPRGTAADNRIIADAWDQVWWTGRRI